MACFHLTKIRKEFPLHRVNPIRKVEKAILHHATQNTTATYVSSITYVIKKLAKKFEGISDSIVYVGLCQLTDLCRR